MAFKVSLFLILMSICLISSENPINSAYSNEWHFRENVFTSTTENSPTSEKTFYQDGWRPIVVQRKIQMNPSFTPKDRFMAFMSKLRKPEPIKIQYDHQGRNSYSDRINNLRTGPVSFNIDESNLKVTIPPQIRFSTVSLPTKSVGQKKKNKFVREDDLMFIHYGPVTIKPVPKFQQLPSINGPETLDNMADSTDMMMEERNLPLEDSRLEDVAMDVSSVSKMNSHSVAITPRSIRSRQLHEIIDKNNKDNFKPITNRVTSTEPTPIEDASADENIWQNLYSIFHNSENELSTKSLKNFDNEIKETNAEQKFSSSYISNNKTKSQSQFSIEDKHKKKVEKLFNKPIVITENPRTNPDYYNQLLDSFGNNADNSEYKSASSTKKYLRIQPIEATDRNDKNVFNLIDTENKTSTLNKYDEWKSSANITKTGGETLNVLRNVTGIDIADLVPKTLKSNMFLVKRLFVDCYSDLDEHGVEGNTFSCLKKISIKILDRAISSDVIKFSDAVTLVKENETDISPSKSRSITSETSQDGDWVSAFIEKIYQLFSTHSLKVKLINGQENSTFRIEGRRRHTFRRVFPVLTAIYMTITAVLIPLVFQFMAMMGGKAFIVSKIAVVFALVSSFSKLFITPTETPHYHQHPPPPPPPPPPHASYYSPQHALRRRRRHYRRVFPIMVGAYMILSTVLIPLGFKFMTLLGTKSLFLSKLSLFLASMNSIKRLMGYGHEHPSPPTHPSPYPAQYYPYPSYSSPYYDMWRRDELRKLSHPFDEPTDYAHYTEELE